MSPPKIQRVMYLLSKLWDHNAFASVVFLSVQHTWSWYWSTSLPWLLVDNYDNEWWSYYRASTTCNFNYLHVIPTILFTMLPTNKRVIPLPCAMIWNVHLLRSVMRHCNSTSICMYNLACNDTTVTSAETLNSILLMHWFYISRMITVLHHTSNPLFQQAMTITSAETLSAPCSAHTYFCLLYTSDAADE